MPNYTGEKIGIIGGCGVAAANELVCRIERKLTELGCSDDSEQPEVILFQATLAPNRIAFAAGRSSNSFVPYFIDVGRKLKTCGATICCIACNTAHCAIGEIEAAVGLPFVNIVSEALEWVRRVHPAVRKIGVLGSSGTKWAQVYQSHAKLLAYDCEVLFPDDTLQQSVDDGIAAVKRGLRYVSMDRTRAFFEPAMKNLLKNGADALILGCTEIPLAILDETYGKKPVIDSIAVLADACIGRCFLG